MIVFPLLSKHRSGLSLINTVSTDKTFPPLRPAPHLTVRWADGTQKRYTRDEYVEMLHELGPARRLDEYALLAEFDERIKVKLAMKNKVAKIETVTVLWSEAPDWLAANGLRLVKPPIDWNGATATFMAEHRQVTVNR